MNDTMTLAERADALEHKMMRELDAIIVKSRLFNLADGDLSTRTAWHCSPTARASTC